MQTRKLVCSGYTREQSEELDLKIPKDISKVITTFYFKNFEFDRTHQQFEISDDGLTVSTIRSKLNGGRPTIQFGEYLYHKYGDTFEVTLRIDDGGHSGLIIGFITTGFDEYIHNKDSSSCDPTSYACMAAANGWFKIDTTCFSCDQGTDRKHHGMQYQFMKKKGETLTLSVDMNKRIGRIGEYIIELPDCVAIGVCSNTGHKLTAIEQR